MKHINKDNIKLTLLITLLVTITLGATYAFLYFISGENTATGDAGCFEVNYTGEIISNLTNYTVQTNTSGTTNDTYSGSIPSANSQVTISKASTCKIYTEGDIYIQTNTETTAPIETIPALKYKVSTGSTTISTGVINTKEDYRLATVSITETATTYDIYLWIDSNISGGSYNETTYSGYIFAESSQTSTFKNNSP